MLDLHHTLCNMGRERPVFHSRDDLARSLVMALHTDYPSALVCAEYRPFPDGLGYIGVWERPDGPATVIQLRYATGKLERRVGNESFALKYHGANDQHRYDFLKDTGRLEEVVTV